MEYDSDFLEYICVVQTFINFPSKENLRAWMEYRYELGMRNKGYCHPFGDYSLGGDLNCLTGKDKWFRAEGRVCPMYVRARGTTCRLKTMTPVSEIDETYVAKMLALAIEIIASYKSRFPDL